jgi:hypothetical protein
MKRSKPLKASPERVREWQQRSRKPLKQGRKSKPVEHQMDPKVCYEAYLRQGGFCICGCGRRISRFPIGYHHLLPRQRWPELTNDHRNIVGVYEDCHAGQESGMTRLPRSACATVEQLALSPQQLSYLERTYGPREA